VTAATLALPRAGRRRRQAAPPAALPRAVTAVPLLLVLAVQAYLTYGLIKASSASGDESLYIYAGHQLIYEALHGGGSPYYETWLSGAPVLYPVAAATLDHVGGLLLAREFSMGCMLCATALLHLTARRMFGYWAGVTAALLFALLGITHGLGVLATYDAPSLLLMALAAYAAIRAPEGARWLLAVPLLLLAANGVKYASVLFDPVVIGLAAFQLHDLGWRRMGWRAVSLGAAVSALLGLAVFLAGSAYWQGIEFTTLARPASDAALYGWSANSPSQVWDLSWSAIGLVVIVGFGAVAVAAVVERRPSLISLLGLLAAAGTLVTIEGVRYRSATSVTKHDDFGVWFTCIAGGYALARAAELARSRPLKSALAAVAVGAAAWTGLHYTSLADRDPDRIGSVPADYAALRPYLGSTGREYLLGGLLANQIVYDNHLAGHWWEYVIDTYVKYPIPGRGGDWHGQAQGTACYQDQPGCMYLEGAAGFAAAIKARQFAVVSLLGAHQAGAAGAILAAVKSTPGYVLATTAGGAPTYIYAPDYPRAAAGGLG
jgi:hypothetical protein